ncbi:unnamed protein product [Linum tenue]|uniref:C3H1-type domain-containing protein n=1 Tax=Linum tenue TaxID=586396 RepID=A0AAV0IJK2_9ROSI|nr:unnamed protein product [Linum tenue]
MASPQSSLDQLPPSSPQQAPNPTPAPISAAAEETFPETAEKTVDPSPEADSSGAKRKRDEENPEPETKPDPSSQPWYKTSLCSYFRRNSGSCAHGSTCRYAHSEGELRPRPDNSWDPTSERAKKALKLDKEEEEEDEKEKEDEIMMTDMIADEGDANGGCLDVELSKCLVHLPRRWTTDNLKKFLSESGVSFKLAKKKKGMTVGFVTFENLEQLAAAVPELEEKSVGNKKIKVANVLPRSYDKNIKTAMDEGENAAVSKSSDGTATVDGESLGADDGSNSKAKCARDAVTPLAHISYGDQLEQKKKSVAQMLIKLTRNTRKACPTGVSLPEWILKAREIGNLPCKLEGILESPLVNGYRNKCEFSVGHSLGGKPTVGFMLGNFRAGVTAVDEPVDCPNVSSIALKYALIFQEFLQQSSLPMWNRFKNTGFWRQLTVREGRLPGKPTDTEHPEANISEVMLMVQVSTKGFDDAIVTSELERLTLSFTNGAAANSPPLPLTALVLQDHQGISNVAPSDAPLRMLHSTNAENGTSAVDKADNTAEPRIHDYISNLRFSISPTAFFQVNTLAAEKLYALAGDWADLGPDTLLFDVCCGTGTIGLTLAHRVGMVVGIEMNASAVSDANRNAELNGIKNCRFVAGKAEHVIGSLLQEYLIVPEKKEDELPNSSETIDKAVATSDGNEGDVDEKNPRVELVDSVDATKDSENGIEVEGQPQSSCSAVEDGTSSSTKQFKNVVAIVDPPRNGLHPIVIKALRTHSGLRRLVYISCNPETLVANAIELCTPSPETVEKGNKNNRAWRNMSSAGLARHRAKSMPISEPFRPVKAMAVDLFPHTPHCELVMLLER